MDSSRTPARCIRQESRSFGSPWNALIKFAESLKALAALAKTPAVVLEFYGVLSPFKVTVPEPLDGYTVEAMFAPIRVP